MQRKITLSIHRDRKESFKESTLVELGEALSSYMESHSVSVTSINTPDLEEILFTITE